MAKSPKPASPLGLAGVDKRRKPALPHPTYAHGESPEASIVGDRRAIWRGFAKLLIQKSYYGRFPVCAQDDKGSAPK